MNESVRNQKIVQFDTGAGSLVPLVDAALQHKISGQIDVSPVLSPISIGDLRSEDLPDSITCLSLDGTINGGAFYN